MVEFLPFLIILMLLAALLREDSILLVFYLIGGVYVFSQWWNRRLLNKIAYRREFTRRAFQGESIAVRLHIENPSRLPSLWLYVHESLPTELITPNFASRVIQLPPHGHATLDYTLHAHKRGYYPIGPVYFRSGDFFGLSAEAARQGESDRLIIYPEIIPLKLSRLPSHSPYGTLRHREPIFEDPSRVGSKREYRSGDSLRRMDWKASASTGLLLIKQFQSSIALETCICLDLYEPAYLQRSRIQTTEMAIIAAASLANWVIAQKQSVGLATNGIDPLVEDEPPAWIRPRKGRQQLIAVLDILARIHTGQHEALPELLQRGAHDLAWGTTLLVITGSLDDRLFSALFQARRRGLNVFVTLVGPTPNLSQVKSQSEYFGISLQSILSPRDLETWR